MSAIAFIASSKRPMFSVELTVVHDEKKKLDQPKIFILIFVFASIFRQYEQEPKPAPEAEKSSNVFVIAKQKRTNRYRPT